MNIEYNYDGCDCGVEALGSNIVVAMWNKAQIKTLTCGKMEYMTYSISCEKQIRIW